MRTRREWHHFQVNVTGAFLTGAPLDVRISEYSRLQVELAEALTGDPDQGWEGEGPQWRNQPSYKYGGGGYSSLVPLVLVQRSGDSLVRRVSDLVDARPKAELNWMAEKTEGCSLVLRSATVQIYDLGVGVIVGTYDVSTPIWMAPGKAREMVESLGRLRPDLETGTQSPLAAAYKELARESAGAFRDAAMASANGSLREPWLTPLLAVLPDYESDGIATSDYRPADEGEWGRMLWLHPIYVLGAKPSATMRRLGQLAEPFQAPYSRSVGFPKGTFVPGIDWSVVSVRGDLEGQEVPVKLIALHWAYYALFMEMDRGLLATLDSDTWNAAESLGALEADAERMFCLYLRVKEARARLDSALTDLGGGQLSLWEAIADVTKFEELVTSVEEKIKVLQRVAEHRVLEATAARARTSGRILSGLTALTVVTVMVALIGNFYGTRSDAIGHLDLRVAVILLAFLLAAILFREAQRDRLRRAATNEFPRIDAAPATRPEL